MDTCPIGHNVEVADKWPNGPHFDSDGHNELLVQINTHMMEIMHEITFSVKQTHTS